MIDGQSATRLAWNRKIDEYYDYNDVLRDKAMHVPVEEGSGETTTDEDCLGLSVLVQGKLSGMRMAAVSALHVGEEALPMLAEAMETEFASIDTYIVRIEEKLGLPLTR